MKKNFNNTFSGIWFDFSNPPHVNLFRPIIQYFESQGITTFSTARNFVETTALLDKYSIKYRSFGSHGGKNRVVKLYNLIKRDLLLYKNIPDFRLSISSSFEAPEISWLKGNPSVVFDDNETAPNWLYAYFAKYVIAPSVIDKKDWVKNGISDKKVIPYNGFKEDIYIADYYPDPTFLGNLPFNSFVTVRPENLYASYVNKQAVTIVPELLNMLLREGYNILYLPRYGIDRSYAPSCKNIYIPEKPLNGLDVAEYSDILLTGAGTFAREAALLGTPSVSFFAGEKLLSVDKYMINKGLIFHSRNPQEILKFVNQNYSKKRIVKREKSKKVQTEVFNILFKIYNSY